MATFRKRGPSRWEAQVRRRGWPTRTGTFQTKADAQAWAADTEAAMHKGSYSDGLVVRSIIVNTYQATPRSNFFQRNTTGYVFTGYKPLPVGAAAWVRRDRLR